MKERFKKISRQYIGNGSAQYATDIEIYYDTETLVMYQFVSNRWGGGVSPILNADGTPVLYVEEKEKIR